MKTRTRWRAVAVCLALLLPAVLAHANEKSAPYVAEARKKLRSHDTAGAIKALADAVAADSADADAQLMFQELQRASQPEKSLQAQYRALASASPEDTLLQYLATRLLKPDEAAREFDKLQAKFPDCPWFYEGRAVALASLPRDKERDKEIDKEFDNCFKAGGTREARFYVSQARNYERVGLWGQAVSTWQLALSKRPADVSLMLGFGEALRKSGAIDDAIAQFEIAQKADPGDPEPPYRIGLARLDAGKPEDALKALDASIALDRLYVDAYSAAVRASIIRARLAAQAAKRAMQESDFVPALAYGTNAVKADPANVAAHLALAGAEEAATEFAPLHADASIREYDTALTLMAPTALERASALCGKSFVLLEVERFDEALAAADKANDIDPHLVTSYLCGGRALSGKGESDGAIKKYLNPGLKIAPDDPRLRHARGIAYWELNKSSEAKKDLEAASEADPRNARYMLSVGEIYYELKMYAQGAKILVAAADLRPHDPEVWRALGRTCTALKDYEQAAKAYEEVVTLVEGDGSAPAPAAPEPAAPDGTPPAPGATPPAPGATPPAPGATPPAPGATPPAPGAPPPAPGTDPGAPPAPTPPAEPPKPKFATSEHLYLAVIYEDHLNDHEKAKAHARKFVDQGGTNVNLDQWVQKLLAEK